MDRIKYESNTHHGNNIKRLRRILDLERQELANKMGINQRTLFDIENKEKLEDKTLEKAAQALGIPVEMIKKLENDGVYNIITNNTFNITGEQAAGVNANPCFTMTYPIEKIIEAFSCLLREKENKIEELQKIILTKQKNQP